MASIGLIDLDKERDGAWFENPRGYAVKVRPLDSPTVEERLAKDVAAALGASGKTALGGAAFAAMLRIVIAEEVLVDWRDIDQAPTFSKEKARELMTDPRARLFQDFVAKSAREIDKFEAAGVEKILGN